MKQGLKHCIEYSRVENLVKGGFERTRLFVCLFFNTCIVSFTGRLAIITKKNAHKLKALPTTGSKNC